MTFDYWTVSLLVGLIFCSFALLVVHEDDDRSVTMLFWYVVLSILVALFWPIIVIGLLVMDLWLLIHMEM